VLLLTLAGIQFAHVLDFVVMMPLGPILMRELAVGTHEFGLLVSAYTFMAAITGVVAGAVGGPVARQPGVGGVLGPVGF
jgi:predicted MFS family arabinose efflux permease